MRVIVSAGGTGGHIYPALAIINKIKKENSKAEILYIGTTNRMEKDIIPSHNIKYIGLEMHGFERKNIFKNFNTIRCFFNAIKESKKIIKDYKPDVVIGVGGYITAPVIYAAKKLGIKTLIHEQNSVFGLSNKFLLRYSDIIATSFKSSVSNKYSKKIVYTGNPCSEDAISKSKMSKKSLGLSDDKKLVIIVMGSLGSYVINNKLKEILPSFHDEKYEVLFITGNDYYESFKSLKLPKNVHVKAYVEDMVRIMKSSDLVVSRAGATTLSEIIALSIPSILIPSPHVTDNHQFKNAMDLVNKNAAILILEDELNKDILIDSINEILFNTEKNNTIKKNLSKYAVLDSSTRIYKEIIKLIGDK